MLCVAIDGGREKEAIDGKSRLQTSTVIGSVYIHNAPVPLVRSLACLDRGACNNRLPRKSLAR